MIKTTPREYQNKIFQTAREKNTLVVLPTGIGKTLIALLLTIDRLKLYPGSKTLFLAPTKPLVEQHFQSYTKELPELFADLQIFTGSVPAEKRKEIFQTADIIFSTPQCIANDLNNHLYSLEEVSLIIIDEAHRCLKNYSYTAVASAYKKQAKNQRILALTASPGYDLSIVKEICSHLNIDEVESRTRDSEDVKPYLQTLEFEKIEVDFPKEFEEIRVLLKRFYDQRIDQLKSRSLLFGPANKITLLKLQKRLGAQASSGNFNYMIGLSLSAQAIKISHAIELLETQTLNGLNSYLQGIIKQSKENKSRAAQIIAKSPEFNASLISLNLLLSKNIEHPKINALKELIKNQFEQKENSKMIVFTQFRETARIISSELNKINHVISTVFLGQAKKTHASGVSGLNQKEQRAMIDQFRSGKTNVLCATSIGEEGLDIPEVSAVVFYEPIPSAIRKIQRTGRTARLAPGKLFILMTKDTRDIAFHYASSARERKMHKTIEILKNEFKERNKNKILSEFK